MKKTLEHMARLGMALSLTVGLSAAALEDDKKIPFPLDEFDMRPAPSSAMGARNFITAEIAYTIAGVEKRMRLKKSTVALLSKVTPLIAVRIVERIARQQQALLMAQQTVRSTNTQLTLMAEKARIAALARQSKNACVEALLEETERALDKTLEAIEP